MDDRKASVNSHRHKSVSEQHVTSVLGANEVAVIDRDLTADEEVLAALGYKYEIPLLQGRCEHYILTYYQTRISTRVHSMDNILCLFCRARASPLVRCHSLLWLGLCWPTWYGLGMDHSYGRHSVHRHGNG